MEAYENFKSPIICFVNLSNELHLQILSSIRNGKCLEIIIVWWYQVLDIKICS